LKESVISKEQVGEVKSIIRLVLLTLSGFHLLSTFNQIFVGKVGLNKLGIIMPVLPC
jgi:vacuolar-type H+-ATPase subunit I/STV1